MRDASGEMANGFHLLCVPQLLLQGALLRHIFGEEFKEAGIAFTADVASGQAHDDRTPVLADPLGD